MAKKLSDIEHEIRSQEGAFLSYLEHLLDEKVFNFINELSRLGNLYLFSGIIRNYFLKVNEVRDVDLMIDSTVDIHPLVKKYHYRKNSYGGYKIDINGIVVDLWYMRDTWALNNSQQVIGFELEQYIPKTAFFNFSSIIFSFKDQEFIYSKEFLRFLRDKQIDYVFKPNANYALCVVNSFYYHDKLKLSFSDKLKEYLYYLDQKYYPEYEKVQLKHFGKVIYPVERIRSEIKSLELKEPRRLHKLSNKRIQDCIKS